MQDALLVNKIAAAILTAALIAMTAGFIAGFLYNPTELAQDAFVIEVEEGGAATAVAEAPAGPEPISALLAAASVEDGQKLAKRCASCHKFEKGGANGVGPGLWNVVNADKGIVPGYNYSPVMGGFDGIWGYEELNEFLYDPKGYMPGTKMAFRGLKKTNDRANMIAYLRSLSDSPAPLP